MVLLCASFLFSVLCAERLSLPVTSNLSQTVQVRRQQQRSASSHWHKCLPSRQVDVAVPTPEQQKLGLQGGGFRQFPVRSRYAAHGLLCRIIICHYSQVHRLLRQQRLCLLHFRGQKGPSEVDIPHRRQCASVTAVVPFRRQAVCGQLRQLCLRARYYNHRIKLLKLCCEPRQSMVLHAC